MDSFVLIIFGITSNLAQIKLIPALYDIAEKNLLPEKSSIIGVARQPRGKEEFRQYFRHTLSQKNKHHTHSLKDNVVDHLLSKLHYVDGDVEDPALFQKLSQFLDDLGKQGSECQNKIFYLATYPELYEQIFENLKSSGLNSQENGWTRLMIEKPIGNDLTSAKALNTLLAKYFNEEQIFRLDHYLGKETLQNILAFRFGNGIFEPLLNKDYIDHIQITALEDFGIGARGGYYDKVGALKDVGQNHLLQMLTFATMDAPSEFSNDAIVSERIKVLKSLVSYPDQVVFGQYEGYLNEPKVEPNSQTDTYFAFKTEINNARFKGVPIYVRGGKKLAQTVTEIAIIFKSPVNSLFKNLNCGDEPNVLIFRIQPNEGIVLRILTKRPGHELIIDPEYMQFCYKITPDSQYLPDAYERLIVDAIKGDPTFFNDAVEVEAQWAFIDPLVGQRKKPVIYKPGAWGPQEADELIVKDGHCWLEPSMDFCRI